MSIRCGLVICLFAGCLSIKAAQPKIYTLHPFNGIYSATSEPAQITGGDYVAGLSGNNSIGRFTQQGVLSILYALPSSRIQGEKPNALLQASDGNLYGTCYAGGAGSAGTIFKLTLDGQFTLLYTFHNSDGTGPVGKLVEGDDGNFYGVTQTGGTTDAGTIFRVTPAGIFTSLFSFNGTTTGSTVNDGLILATDGDFYGTTFAGGTNPQGAGTVFKISPQGNFTLVYSFDGPDGYFPSGPVMQRSDGTFYGTTTFGGYWDFGVVYQLTPGGQYSIVAQFNDNTNGADPFGALIEGSDGNLYGITDLEYYYLGGTVFRLDTSGHLTTLATFGEGDEVIDGLLQAEGGGIRGFTYNQFFTIVGGIPEPKPAIAKFGPVAGKAGTVVTIRGDHFVYANQVTFNGVPATFHATSANYIIAVVPPGATTGPIAITNVGGTTTSSTNFTVQ